LAPANAAGFGAFEQALSSGLFSSAVAVKGQIEGPITLSAYLFHKSRPFLSDPTLFSAVAFHVSQILGRQIDRLKSAGLPVLLFVDEPALCLDACRERGRFSEHPYSLAESGITGWRSPKICSARDDHGNLQDLDSWIRPPSRNPSASRTA
jgi:hypothetical protein